MGMSGAAPLHTVADIERPYVFSIIKSFHISAHLEDDCYQDILEMLIRRKAAERFDPSRNVLFKTYIYTIIRNWLKSHFREYRDSTIFIEDENKEDAPEALFSSPWIIEVTPETNCLFDNLVKITLERLLDTDDSANDPAKGPGYYGAPWDPNELVHALEHVGVSDVPGVVKGIWHRLVDARNGRYSRGHVRIFAMKLVSSRNASFWDELELSRSGYILKGKAIARILREVVADDDPQSYRDDEDSRQGTETYAIGRAYSLLC